jgi:hypothetical protein
MKNYDVCPLFCVGDIVWYFLQVNGELRAFEGIISEITRESGQLLYEISNEDGAVLASRLAEYHIALKSEFGCCATNVCKSHLAVVCDQKVSP